QLLDLLELVEEVLEGEAGLAELALHLLGLLAVDLLLGPLDQGEHVAHAEDPPGQAVGVEGVEVGQLIAGGGGPEAAAGTAGPTPRRASPSSLVRTNPVTSTPSWNAWAVATASWPVMASTTSSTSVGWTASRMAAAWAIISASMASRPAVSTITTSRPV